MLEARGLTKSYASVPAVKDVTFTLSTGQVLGCLGPNGSGKSTTVKMLTGLLEPTRGEVLFNGENIQDDLSRFRKCLGYVPEEPNLYPYLSGREYLELVGTLRGMPVQAWSQRSMRSSICSRSTPTGTHRLPPTRRGCASAYCSLPRSSTIRNC
jgi:ABC-2 type transport system ATP-binding protein